MASPCPLAGLDPSRQEKAREYARLLRRLFLVELALGGAFMLILWLSGLSAGLRDLLPSSRPAQVALYFLLILFLYSLLLFPLSLYSGYYLPRRYGLSIQALGSWLRDLAKGALIGLVLGIGLLEALYWLLGRFPDTWWLWAALMVLLVSVVLTHLAPVIILPLFFKSTPLTDPELARRLLDLAQRAGLRVKGVFTLNYSSKGTGANAALAGLGRTRRILLTDTLLQRYTPEEVEVALAHEMGHQAHRDIPRMLLSELIFVLAGFYLLHLLLRAAVAHWGIREISDVAALPLLALGLGLFNLLVRPLAHAYSRHRERAADLYALRLTSKPDAFVSLMSKLTDQNLAEADPSPWVEALFYDHPPFKKRAALAQGWTENRDDRPSIV